MTDCIFCKIVSREISSYSVWEDEEYFAFLDVYPATMGHTLLIPKKHYRFVYDVPEFGTYWEAALTVTKILQRTLLPKWMNYLTHGGVPHAHIHIMPRYEEDIAAASPAPKQKATTEEELKRVIEMIKSK